MRVLLPLLVFGLVVYALIDCVRTPDEEMPVGMPKVLWVVLIILFPGIAAVAWIVVSRVARAQSHGPARQGLWSAPPPPQAPRRSGPLAPDDDPEFLRRLEAQRREADRQRRRREIAGQETREIGPGPAAGHGTGSAPGDDPSEHDGDGDDGGPAPKGGTASQR